MLNMDQEKRDIELVMAIFTHIIVINEDAEFLDGTFELVKVDCSTVVQVEVLECSDCYGVLCFVSGGFQRNSLFELLLESS